MTASKSASGSLPALVGATGATAGSGSAGRPTT